jgi:hypothetical protein
MTSQPERAVEPRSGPIRDPQSLVAGLALIALAAFAVWAISNLPQGTLRQMGPAMLPRWLAIGVGLCGLALLISAFTAVGSALERWFLRGPVMVVIAILIFAVTIRPFPIGSVSTPDLGLAFAGPLAIIVGGYATPEARLRELLVLGLALTAFCMVLFGDLLNLPIPMFPQRIADMFPAGWSNDGRLRAVAGVMVLMAVVIGLTGRASRSRSVDVAHHTGQV